MSLFKLIDKTGAEVLIGAQLKTFRGDRVYLRDVEFPRSAASTGRIYVTSKKKAPLALASSFFPSVCDLELVEVKS
jgi:hypothetical protein